MRPIVNALAAMPVGDINTMHGAALTLGTLESSDFAFVIDVPHGPLAVPGLAAWLEHVVCWEADRRSRRHYRLAGLDEAIPPNERRLGRLAVDSIIKILREDSEHDNGAMVAFLECVHRQLELATPSGRPVLH